MRSDMHTTERMLRLRDRVFDIRLQELMLRGEFQKQLEVDHDHEGTNHYRLPSTKASEHPIETRQDDDLHCFLHPDYQGSYGVVYRGLWNGSDVAIKVFFGSDYNEEILLDHQKETDIMKRLRHPNVLLFMGACYSYERLAIVTEYLPR